MMRIKTRKDAERAYDSLHQFYRDTLDEAVKDAGSPEKLAAKIGTVSKPGVPPKKVGAKTFVRNAIERDRFNSLRKLVGRLK